jgi:hypothetical protein
MRPFVAAMAERDRRAPRLAFAIDPHAQRHAEQPAGKHEARPEGHRPAIDVAGSALAIT